jgi:regulation of enolase protein 1 (concanavalin A-like superfamily)
MNFFKGREGQKLNSDLRWLNEPSEWSFGPEGLSITPEDQTDFFRLGETVRDNASLLFVEMSGDFTLITETQIDLVAFGDAAALTVRARDDLWAKLCLERSPIGDINVVSVVCRGEVDDANGELLDEPTCYLRISREGSLFGMHYSLDGTKWRFVRAFVLDMPETVKVGVHAQAPFVAGCRALFKSFELSEKPVKDFRSGE